MALFGKPNAEKLRAKRDVSGLIQLLRHKDVDVRLAAVHALGDLRDDRAIDPLVDVVLSDPHVEKGARLEDMERWPVSAAAARALAEIGPHAVAPLMTAMKNPNATTQPKAFFALGLLRWEPALDELTRIHGEIKSKLAEHEERIRSEQGRAEMGRDPETADQFLLLAQVYLVKDEAASWAIKQMGGEPAQSVPRPEAAVATAPSGPETEAAPEAAEATEPSTPEQEATSDPASELVARWPSGPAGVCDICSTAITPQDSHLVAATEFQGYVRRGYNPHTTGRMRGTASDNLASALGLGADLASEGWKTMALQEVGDWGLCRLCAEDVARFVAR